MGCACCQRKLVSDDENEYFKSIQSQKLNQSVSSNNQIKEENIDIQVDIINHHPEIVNSKEKIEDSSSENNEISDEIIMDPPNLHEIKEGTIFLQDSTVYTGHLIGGIPNGQGKLILGQNNFYKGDFSNGNFEGFGKYKKKDYTYEGYWKNSKKEGEGVEVSEKFNQTYNGQFVNDLKDGDGVLNIQGVKIFGQFSNGNLVSGIWKKENKKFEGSWKNNKLRRLTVEGPNGAKLKLRFKRNGSMKLKFPDGKTSILQNVPNSRKFNFLTNNYEVLNIF